MKKYQIKLKESVFHSADDQPFRFIAGYKNEFASREEAEAFVKYHYDEFFADGLDPDDFYEIVHDEPVFHY